MNNFYTQQSSEIYSKNLIPVDIMTLNQLDDVIADSLFSRDKITDEWRKEEIRLREAKKRRLKLIALIAIIAVASAAVAVSGTPAASAGAISAQTGAAIPLATEASVIGSSATVTTTTAATTTATKTATLLKKIQTTAKYVGSVAGTIGGVTGNETALKLAQTATLIGSADMNKIVSQTATNLLSQEGLSIKDEQGMLALKERLKREQEVYAQYLNRQADYLDEKTVEPVKTGKSFNIKDAIIIATPFLLHLIR